MKKISRILLFIAVVLALGSALLYNVPKKSPAANPGMKSVTLDNGEVDAQPSKSFIDVPSAAYAVLVVEDGTEKPIVGAEINTVCTGGTPYATNMYRTDVNGYAKVMYFANGFAAVNVSMSGYETAFPLVSKTNYIVRLKRRLKHLADGQNS